MTVSDILDFDSFENEWTNDDYNVPMMADAQPVVSEVGPNHATSASGGEPSSDSEGSDGETEGDDVQEEDGEEDMLSLGLGGFDDGSEGLWTIPKTGDSWSSD